MQLLPVYLYSNILNLILDMDTLTKGVNNSMYQRDLTIQKGLKNQIKIQFKNSDQKKIRIYNSQTFIFSMFDSVNNRLLIEKPLEILDNATTSTKGLALLTLTESDTLFLEKSSYSFMVKLKDDENSFIPTYANTYYGVHGTLHLENKGFPTLIDSISITSFNKVYNDTIQKYEFKSGNIYASPEYSTNSLHTMAIYMTHYKGMVFVDATLDNSPGINSNYSTIVSRNYTDFTGIDPINFNGIYSFIRIRYIPDSAPGESNNDNPAYYGAVDKILYRS